MCVNININLLHHALYPIFKKCYGFSILEKPSSSFFQKPAKEDMHALARKKE